MQLSQITYDTFVKECFSVEKANKTKKNRKRKIQTELLSCDIKLKYN